MSDRPTPGADASGSPVVPGNGSGSGHPEEAVPAGRPGPVERLRDEIVPRKLTASIMANTGTIIVTAVAGIIVAEFGRGWLPGLLTFVVAVAAGLIASLVIFYLPDQKRGSRSELRAAAEQEPSADGEVGEYRAHRVLRRGWAAAAVFAGLAVLAGVSYGVVRAFARGWIPGALSVLAAVFVAAGVPLLWRQRQSLPTLLRRLRPGSPLRRDSPHSDRDPDGPDHGKGWITYPRARVVMACALATAAVMTGTELGLSVHASACPVPTELRILASPEDLPAIQAVIPAFEHDESRYVGSTCFAVQLTAYAPESAPTADQLATDFDSGWDQQAMSDIGPEPDIWIPDSMAEVTAVQSSLPSSGPVFGQPRPVGYSPLVVAVPATLVSQHSLGQLEHDQSWSSLYTDFTNLGIKLALPSPDLSEAGLFEITALYQGANLSAALERPIEASGDFPQDSQALLCEASQPGQSIDTAYLVSEAAMADYDDSIHDPAEDPCPASGQVQPMRALYPAGTATLDFPFTTVNWGHNQDARRRRYEDGFYTFLTSPDGISALESQGLRPPGCGTGGTINPADGIQVFDQSCEKPSMPAPAATGAALAAFTRALPDASVLIGIDDSAPMKPDLPQITSAIDTVLNPGNASPLGAGDHFGIWELPGTGQATDARLVNFEPATSTSLQQVPKQLASVMAHQHSADYDMLTDAADRVLYGQRPVLPGTGTAPVNAVVLITDGDGYSGHDLGGGTAVTVRKLFTHPYFGQSSIALYIIAFGPAGCTPTMLNLADATHGACYPADGGDPRQLLGQALDQITGE